MRTRWHALWQRLGGATAADTLFDALVAQYSEAQRAYHNLAHVAHCLRELDSVHDALQHPDEAELALWYHDAVYDPRRHDNEAQSAALARAVLLDAGLARDAAERVASLVLATRHDVWPASGDAGLVADADLAILGQPTEVFEAYERRIRQEYDWVDPQRYARGRRAVLSAFLAREPLFSSLAFRLKYEEAARSNLTRVLATGYGAGGVSLAHAPGT